MTTDYFVHPTSVVDNGAVIGKGTRIWHFSHLMPGAKVGENCNIGQNVFIDNNVSVGNGVKIQNNVSLYNGVSVDDDVFLGPSMVFTNVMNPRSFIERKSEFRPTRIGRGASIGANATIVCGIEIGMYAFVGAGAVILRDVPPFALMVGNPARQVGWMSKTGDKLKFNSENIAWCEAEQVEYILKDQLITIRVMHSI